MVGCMPIGKQERVILYKVSMISIMNSSTPILDLMLVCIFVGSVVLWARKQIKL